jgi:hypothetical protein
MCDHLYETTSRYENATKVLTMGLRRPRRHTVPQGMRKRLVDEAFERYVEWRQESAAVGDAYGNWLTAAAAEGALSFAAYRAALDREDRAATLYGTVIDRLEHMLGFEREPAEADS